MKVLTMAVVATLTLSGCAIYSKPGGDAMQAEYDRRECGQQVRAAKDYPTRAEAFTPGGMDRAAVKIEQLQDACMARDGYKRS